MPYIEEIHLNSSPNVTTIDKSWTRQPNSDGVIADGFWSSRDVSTFDQSFADRRVEKSWARTPDYYARRKAGTLPVNGFTYGVTIQEAGRVFSQIEERSNTDFLGSYVQKTRVECAMAAVMGPQLVNSFTMLTHDDLYLAARSKLSRDNWSAPVFVAELRKSSEMVFNAAMRMASTYRSLRRGRFADATSALFDGRHVNGNSTRLRNIERRYRKVRAQEPSKAASSAWLELQYGWIPLMLDVKSSVAAAELLATDVKNHVWHLNRSLLRSELTTDDEFVVMVTPSVIATRTTQRVESRRLELRYTTQLEQRSFQVLGLANPLEVAWELVPLSFVADWFLPIGDYLSTLDAGVGVEFSSGGSEGERVEVTTMYAGGRSGPNGFSCGASGSHKSIFVRRTALDSLPAVMPQNLTVNPDVGLRRFTSALALLSVFRKGS